MTLISIQSRIHFAAHVLEEALRAELDEGGHRHLLVLCQESEAHSDLATRVISGVPNRCQATRIAIAPEHSKYDTRDRALAQIDAQSCDAVIAFGSARAIAFARKCRQDIAKQRYSAVPAADRKGLREKSFLPDFFAIPGIDGLPDPCTSSVGAMAGFKIAPPSVIICDPSIAEDASATGIASAYANALGRCLEALTSAAFNPIADGLAIEGLRRLVLTRTDGGTPDDVEGQRNLMAASLNSAIAQEKGPGAIQIFAAALAQHMGRDVDVGAVKRILLPAMQGDQSNPPMLHDPVIRDILGLTRATPLQDGLAHHLNALPLPHRLGDLDLTRHAVNAAARTLQEAAACPVPPPDRLDAILDAAF